MNEEEEYDEDDDEEDEDKYDEEYDQEDEEYHDAYATWMDARQQMNAVKLSRGFFKKGKGVKHPKTLWRDEQLFPTDLEGGPQDIFEIIMPWVAE